ncbi:hypothetical protein BDA99DRAFT_538888 [Phascolomyces articulosus]|uniref:Succinylglutamate desuccinylase/Aspartoacylase catalytic domain-containing protein n=1 Tax=Phascolomyces articulosus TaxID=60185 RepID=A0AAD5JXE3_9FUNG|nr:hypothetical protein BDA99DRAFT_538888 [Phascolomyces articulosus]
MSLPTADLPQGSMLEEDSPEPTLIKVKRLSPSEDYKTEAWKNGLGETSEISIYPPEMDYKTEDFFWRFNLHKIYANCNFSVFPGYECTTIVLPDESKKSTLLLNHKGEEMSTNVKPLFPYSWNGAWPTSCRVSNGPITNLQFMYKKDLGTAQFYVEKIGQPISNESGETGQKLLLGSFALVYVVDGFVRITLDKNHLDGQSELLLPGETLYIERDEEASPTSIVIQAADSTGSVGGHELDATVIVMEISESKQNNTTVPSVDDTFGHTMEPLSGVSGVGAAPSQRREPRRKGSLVVYDDQPLINQLGSTSATTTSTTASVGGLGGITSEPMPIPGSMDVEVDILASNLQQSELASVDEGMRRDSIAMLRGKLDTSQVYEPPSFALLPQDTDVPPPVVRDRLVIEDFPINTISTAWIKMVKQGLSEWVRLPAIICRGSEDGMCESREQKKEINEKSVSISPVVGITAAVHGNELNGVPCIHRVVSEIDVKKLQGTVVAVPCVNMVGYLQFKREFADGRDLNRQFPGKEDGFASQVYCYQLMNKVISQFNFLIDLHTASFGRVNSYYVRADMNDSGSALLARLQQPQIVLHNSGQDGTLRSAASARGIKAITVEIGNPQLFQNRYVQWSYMGVMRILDNLGMFELNGGPEQQILLGPPNTVLCSKGFWIYTRTGGVLEVYPGVNTIISKGDVIARIKNIFGNVVDEYMAPCGGIVIGRSSNPVAMSGDRILHLGVIKRKGETLPKEAKENY